MNQKLKKKWISALRSGKFQQGTGMLQTRNTAYCCLGVLCEIDPDVELSDGVAFIEGRKIGVLDIRAAMERYGLDREVTHEGRAITLHDKLTELNDERGYNFNQIASYLEKVNF